MSFNRAALDISKQNPLKKDLKHKYIIIIIKFVRMSDKKPSKDTLLKKKSSRKKRAVSKIDKEVDIEKVKELIQKEMTNLKDRAPM